MKNNLFFVLLVLCLTAVQVSGQINQTCDGDIGVGTSTITNVGGYDKVVEVFGYNSAKVTAATAVDAITTSLMSSQFGDWGGVGTQSNHKFVIKTNGIGWVSVSTDGEVNISNRLRVGSYSNAIKLSQTALYGQASSFDFNTNYTTPGIIFEQGISESSGFYSDGDFAVIWSPGDQSRLLRVYDEDGMVEKWYLDASGYAHTISDSSMKENIQSISRGLSSLLELQGVQYNYKSEDIGSGKTGEINAVSSEGQDTGLESTIDSVMDVKDAVIDYNKYDPSKDTYYGFIAQDVENTFPELVGEDENGRKFISYTEFIPLLVEAVKEQQALIGTLQAEIEALKSELHEQSTLKSALIAGNSINNTVTIETALFQNTPNPFTQTTTIEYSISEIIQDAVIYVYDMSGKQMKSIPLIDRGRGAVTIEGSELDAGMYLYTLIANGQLVDTKRMILTD